MAVEDADNVSDTRADVASTSCCRCRRCDADLTRLTGAARFCYQCGSPLDLEQRTADRPPLPVLPYDTDLFSTMIVRGYAHAIFRLGTHYEVRRNAHEAVRCYGKASRLGSEPARARLARRPPEPVAAVGDVDEDAPGLPEDLWIDEWVEFRRRLDP